MERILEEVGLSKNEAKIYLRLLREGSCLAGTIAKLTGIHRRNVYDSIERLIKKGLVGYIKKNNRMYFRVVEPERFIEILKEKEEIIREILPKLRLMPKKENEEILFFRGKNGLKSIFEDQLREKKEILIVGASKVANKILKYYFHWFNKRRVKERIKVKIIAAKGQDFSDVPLSEVRYIAKKYHGPGAFNVYGNKVVILHWSEENPLAILIKNKGIAESYKNYFELLWKIARQ